MHDLLGVIFYHFRTSSCLDVAVYMYNKINFTAYIRQ